MPFNDVYNREFIRAPLYSRVDLSLQYRSRVIVHRFLTRYDAYLNVLNCLYRVNYTDFYWDYSMTPTPIEQYPLFIELGLRFALRL